ncbi:unnamed protein product [Tilletia controversa]|nr:unnamed protein product [Tilletia controversa]
MSNISTVDYNAYPSNLLSSSRMDILEHMVDGIITELKERDEDGKRVFEHRWNPTTFGGGVDITTIPGVVELLEQHRAEFGIIQDPMCLIAEAMSEYGRYCAARLRLETLIETHIKAGLTTAVNTSSPVSSLHASEDNFAAFYGSEASCNGDDHVHIPAQPTTEEALTIGDIDDESTDSSSSSHSLSTYFTPVDLATQPAAEEYLVGDIPDEGSRSSFSSSASLSMSFKPFHGAARPACEDVSDTIGDISDGSMDSSWSITSVEWSPCLHAAGIDVSPPWRYRYQGLLPTVIGRHFSPMKITAQTHSRIPVQATSPAGGSRGLESFPSFVIGEIEPRPAGKKSKVPQFKVVEPIVAPSCPHRGHEAPEKYPVQHVQVLGKAESNACADYPSSLKAPHRSASTKRKLLSFGSRHQQHRSFCTASPLRRTLVPASSSSFALALDSRLRSPRYLPLRNAPCSLRLALD